MVDRHLRAGLRCPCMLRCRLGLRLSWRESAQEPPCTQSQHSRSLHSGHGVEPVVARPRRSRPTSRPPLKRHPNKPVSRRRVICSGPQRSWLWVCRVAQAGGVRLPSRGTTSSSGHAPCRSSRRWKIAPPLTPCTEYACRAGTSLRVEVVYRNIFPCLRSPSPWLR